MTTNNASMPNINCLYGMVWYFMVFYCLLYNKYKYFCCNRSNPPSPYLHIYIQGLYICITLHKVRNIREKVFDHLIGMLALIHCFSLVLKFDNVCDCLSSGGKLFQQLLNLYEKFSFDISFVTLWSNLIPPLSASLVP